MSVKRSQMKRFMAALDIPVRKAFERAINAARGRANIAAMVRAINAGDIDALMSAAGIRNGMYSQVTEDIRSAYAKSGVFIMAADLPKRFSLVFDINNPRAEEWLKTNSSQLITGDLLPENRAAIQTILQNGMIAGNNPRTTALDIAGRIGKTGKRQGGVIGLTQQQSQYSINMKNVLSNDPRQYFIKDRVTGQMKPRWKLADKRFNKTILKSIETGKPLTKPVINKIVGRYEDKLLKHRADTIARTEVLQAVNEASDEVLRQIIDEGLAPRNAALRIWRHSFSANEREGHLRMNGVERRIDEAFTNPITGAVLQRPGTGGAAEDINCRCYLEHKIDFVAVELAA